MEYVSSIITLHVTLKTKQDECEKFLHTDIMICYPLSNPFTQSPPILLEERTDQ